MPNITVLEPREVPLGGIRAMTVYRTLPHKDIFMVGAWCFIDHYGPNKVGAASKDNHPGMDVAPHPHTGLQTLSWLFEGTISHHDTGDNHALVKPGEMNLMTAGNGIAHTEVTTPDTTLLHGVQLWIALPDEARFGPRDFQHYEPPLLQLTEGATARVFMGDLPGCDLEGAASPVTSHTPLFGAEVNLEPGVTVTLDTRESFEYAVLTDTGDITLTTDAGASARVGHRALGVTDPGTPALTLTAGEQGARVVVLGGEPFEEEIIMWWNFVGRTTEEMKQFREAWQNHSDQFGEVQGYEGNEERFPAPALPGVGFRSRRRRRHLA